MTCPDANQFAQLADGTLSLDEREGVEQHLDHCVVCGELVAELAWSMAADCEPPAGYRIVARSGVDRFVGIGADVVELCAVPGERLGGLVGVPHVVTVRSSDARWIALAPTTRPGAISLAMWRDVLAGVRELHHRGLVHGAISDASVRVDADGCACIDPVPTAVPAHFLAPERLHGGPPSRTADQFALCVGMWRAVAGEFPYAGATPGALAVAMQVRPKMPPDRDARVLRVLARGLAFGPADRWADLDALATALERRPWWRALRRS